MTRTATIEEAGCDVDGYIKNFIDSEKVNNDITFTILRA